MFFNSFEFLIFFIIVVGVYWSTKSNSTARISFLIFASYYFYMSWNWKFAGLILFSTILDFIAGRYIYHTTKITIRRYWLIASLVGNLGCLGFFKYYNFFSSNVKFFFDNLGLNLSVSHWEIILPVGISFYTFQTLSYTIDIYRRNLKPTHSFLNFALFVSFFPQLVAGPIVRAKDFLPQLEKKPKYNDQFALEGVVQIFFGLFKKICIGDVIAVSLVDPAFNNPSHFSGITLLFAVYGYAMQIYCDFSGYSDVAIGAAKILGFKLPKNFNRPYLSTSITDFWRRWHLSLSSWLRDYLYIPLGGNKKGTNRTYINLMITMLLGGLWHGAAWNFIFWGGLHGLFLMIERLIGVKNEVKSSLKNVILKRLFTFHMVCLTWILFRATSAESGFLIFKRIITLADGDSGFSLQFIIALIIGYFIHFFPQSIKYNLQLHFTKYPVFVQAGVLSVLLFIFMLINVDNSPFIYFQF